MGQNVYNKRFIVLVSVYGDLTCVNPGDMYHKMYTTTGKWKELVKVNKPLSPPLAQYVKKWVVETYEV